MPHAVLRGRVTREDRRREPVQRLPFTVPAGTSRIDVRYAFDPGHTLDLGLADPRFGAFPAREGFRGWSGGAREAVFVATDDATPGYLPGPLPEGRWQVLLGLAEVGPQGCAYRVEIRLDDAPRETVAAVAPEPAVRGGPGWYRGDLQAHTHFSDARGSLDDLARAAKARGLDFVAVTDHNTVAHHRAIALRRDADLLLLPGEEVTTYFGHANVWGARDWVDFRAARDVEMARVVEEAHARGGLFSVNHPKAQPGCLGCDWEYAVPEAADAVEVWQGPWALRNWESLARVDALLARGRRLTLVGGSDRHQPPLPERDPPELRVGSPTTWVWAEALSTPALLAGLRRGRAYVSEGPEGPHLEVWARDARMGGTLDGDGPWELRARVRGADGDELRWVGPDGVARTVPVRGDRYEDAWTVTRPPAFLRAEVVVPGASAADAPLAREAADAGKLGPDALAEARRHPWARALSNPLYGPGGAEVERR